MSRPYSEHTFFAFTSEDPSGSSESITAPGSIVASCNIRDGILDASFNLFPGLFAFFSYAAFRLISLARFHLSLHIRTQATLESRLNSSTWFTNAPLWPGRRICVVFLECRAEPGGTPMVSSCGGAGSGMVSVELCHMYGQYLQVLAVGVREHRRVWRSAVTDVPGRTLMNGSITGSRGLASTPPTKKVDICYRNYSGEKIQCM